MCWVLFGPGAVVAQEFPAADFVRASTDATSLNVTLVGRLDVEDGAAGFFEYEGRLIAARTTDLYVAGDHAYIGSYRRRLHIVDISRPEAMRKVAEVTLFGPVVDVKVAGDLAVVGIQSGHRTTENGVAVLDISEPGQPQVIAEVELADVGVHNLFLHRQRAYLAHVEAPGLTVLDLRDPGNPVDSGFWLNDNGFSNLIHDVFIRDNLAFLSDDGPQGGLVILDLTDPDAPNTLSSLPIPESLHSAWYENGYVYCNQELGGPTRPLRVIDASDLRNPVAVNTFFADLPETSTTIGPHNPWAQDGLLYWAYSDAGLRIFDLARPDRPVEIGDFPTGPDSGAWGVQPHTDGLLYVADMELGLLALRFDEPAHRIDAVSLSPERAFAARSIAVTATTSPSPRSASAGIHTVTTTLVGIDPVVAASLVDDGGTPDETAGDGSYSGELRVPDMAIGQYTVITTVEDENGRLYRFPSTFEVVPAATVVEASPSRAPPFSLYEGYPNPFNLGTNIRFSLNRSERVKLEIFNLAGQRIATLADGERAAGDHTRHWNGRDDTGAVVSSGVYFYRLRAGEYSQTRKLQFLQ